MNNVDIGIDFGITNSDVVIHSSNNVSYKSLRSEKNIHLSLKNIIKSIQEDSKIKSISVTGGKHLDLPDSFDNQKIIKKNEIDCIGAGAKKLSQLDSNFLVLSCGSGTACVAYENEISTHLGGTGLGGGTIRGLCKLAALIDDPDEINDLSIRGSQIGDYTLKDVISGPIGNLPEDSIAVHVGNLDMMDKLEKEDICRSIIYLVATNIARLAATTALAAKLNKVVVIGRSPNYFLFKEILSRWIEFSGLEIIYPENREFATALGTLEG
tara:strand:- start:55 stop:858 length:804 start_codon:yes stop_codon:yes gene_type:complete